MQVLDNKIFGQSKTTQFLGNKFFGQHNFWTTQFLNNTIFGQLNYVQHNFRYFLVLLDTDTDTDSAC